MTIETQPLAASSVPVVTNEYPMLFTELQRLSATPDQHFEFEFSAFVRRLEQAFRVEEEWIERVCGKALREHQELHAEVLTLMHHAHARNMASDYSLARKLTGLLPAWFSSHIPNEDYPLALEATREPVLPMAVPAAAVSATASVATTQRSAPLMGTRAPA